MRKISSVIGLAVCSAIAGCSSVGEADKVQLDSSTTTMSVDTVSSLVGAYLKNNNLTRAEALMAQISEQQYSESLWRYSAEIALRNDDIVSAQRALSHVTECGNLALFHERFDTPIECMQSALIDETATQQANIDFSLNQNTAGSPQQTPISTEISTADTEPSPTARTHVIRLGETFYRLSKRYGVSVAELQALNPQLDINAIPIGAAVRIR